MSIARQKHVGERFLKAAEDDYPVVMEPSGVQKKLTEVVGTEERRTEGIRSDTSQKIEKNWRSWRKKISAKKLLESRPVQPIKFFALPNFAEQSCTDTLNASEDFWEDIKFFYVSENYFDPKNAYAVIHSFYCTAIKEFHNL